MASCCPIFVCVYLQVTKAFFAALKSTDMMSEVLATCLDEYLGTNDAETQVAISKLIRRVRICYLYDSKCICIYIDIYEPQLWEAPCIAKHCYCSGATLRQHTCRTLQIITSNLLRDCCNTIQ